MIQNFAPFIQFIAAIYVTICCDNLWKKTFWTPDYFKDYKSILERMGVTDILGEEIFTKVSELGESRQKRSLLRALFMLVLCILLLLYIGFEKCTPTGAQANQVCAMYASVATAICILAFHKKTLALWRRVMVCLFIVGGVYAITFYAQQYSGLLTTWLQSEIAQTILSWTIVIVLVLPIALQLFFHWTYSQSFMRYMTNKFESHIIEYNKAKVYKSGDDINTIADRYKNSVIKNVYPSGSFDPKVPEISLILISDLKSCVKVPSMWRLVQTIIRPPQIQNVSILVTSVASPTKLEIGDTIDMEDKYQKYISLPYKMKMQDFCSKEKILLADFNAYYQRREAQKKRTN